MTDREFLRRVIALGRLARLWMAWLRLKLAEWRMQRLLRAEERKRQP